MELLKEIFGSVQEISPYIFTIRTILVGILLFFALINFLMASGLFTTVQNGAYFPFSSSSVGFSYGSVYTLVPTIVACTWGVENLGVHWGIFITAPALGGLWLHFCQSF